MPSKSKSQQRFMGMVHKCKKTGKCSSPEIKKTAKSMKASDTEDFASTKHKGLPEKKKKKDKRGKKVKESVISEKLAEILDPEFAKDLEIYLRGRPNPNRAKALFMRFKELFTYLKRDVRNARLVEEIMDKIRRHKNDVHGFLVDLNHLLKYQHSKLGIGENIMHGTMIAFINDLCNQDYSSAREKLSEIVDLKIKDKIRNSSESEQDDSK